MITTTTRTEELHGIGTGARALARWRHVALGLAVIYGPLAVTAPFRAAASPRTVT
jgi:hypothetical protein